MAQPTEEARGNSQKRRRRRTAPHRCCACGADLACREGCRHDPDPGGYDPDPGGYDRAIRWHPEKLGLCKPCVTKTSKALPPGYPIDEELRALIYVAQWWGVDVRHTVAAAAVAKGNYAFEELERRLRGSADIGPVMRFWESFTHSPAYKAAKVKAEGNALRQYLLERGRGVPSAIAAAEALTSAPSLKSPGNVRKRASLLRRSKLVR